jgi:hypothetical protein
MVQYGSYLCLSDLLLQGKPRGKSSQLLLYLDGKVDAVPPTLLLCHLIKLCRLQLASQAKIPYPTAGSSKLLASEVHSQICARCELEPVSYCTWSTYWLCYQAWNKQAAAASVTLALASFRGVLF